MGMTIGEVAARSGVPAKTIRFYEEIGLVAPAARSENRYRTYGESEVRTLIFVNRARALGFSLKNIGALLELYRDRHRSSHQVKQLARAHVADLDRRIAELTQIRTSLMYLIDRCHGDERPDCPILAELEVADPAEDV